MSKNRNIIWNSSNVFKVFNKNLAKSGFSKLLVRYINIAKSLEKGSKSTKSNSWEQKLKATKILFSTESYLFKPKVSKHINLKQVKTHYKNGELLVIDEPKTSNETPSLRIAIEREIKKYTTLAIGGIQGDESRQISALLKAAKILAKRIYMIISIQIIY